MNLPTFAAAASLIGSILILIFIPFNLSPGEAKVAALTMLTVGFWATGLQPAHYTSLYFFLFAMLFSVSPPNIVFSGFESAALWLIFGGLILGVAINRTGLGRRIANQIATKIDGSYSLTIGCMVAIGMLFGFLMPSSLGRTVLLTPIAIAMSEQFGFEGGSNGRRAIILAITLGSLMPSFAVLPANVPNMVLSGMAEKEFGIHLLYGEYLLLHFPVLGILKSLIITALIVRMYPDKTSQHSTTSNHQIHPMNKQEKKLSIVLSILLLLWVTDFAHHISPSWVALAGALILLLPKFGIITPQEFDSKVNYSSLIYVAGILGMGAMVSHSGLGNKLADALTDLLPLSKGQSFQNYVSLVLASMITGVVATAPGVPAVLTPFAARLSEVSGLPIKTILMCQVLGFSTIIFPYQSPPLIVGMQLADEKLGPLIKLCSMLAIITILLLLPLDFLWWKYLGWI